ncbi:putative autophagy-related protein 11 [Hydractinia symbiolongicarpus]|uniref:putative autophagy-related protein 11 n=1 Tax=Hydractinia symbiolongicarpus TaxID=13093 RepID=UPI00254E6997|nr:putative autophagy-related protein 11 [Hydractinia symbiolongicarpus]
MINRRLLMQKIMAHHQDVDKSGRGNSPALAVNKVFAKNILKQIGDHNRIKSHKETVDHRKFENSERKKHTQKNLKPFSPLKTMYSDYVAEEKEIEGKKLKRKIITPFEQVKKLVTDAAEFDQSKSSQEEMPHKMLQSRRIALKSNRITLDKRLLNNHLKHTTVHNRLKEEDEMWDQYRLQKKRQVASLKSRSASIDEKNAKYGGSMYCDRESAHVKSQQIRSTRDKVPIFGKWTQKLMEEKEKDPELWGHDGFKSIYREDLKIAKKIKKKKSSTIRISSTESESEESESEEECSNKRRRVVKTISRSNDVQKPVTRKVSIKKIILDNLNQHNEDKTSLKKKKRTPKIERKIQGLHADELEETERKKPIKVRTVEKWGHDGFNELNDGGCSDSPKKKVKSLAVIKRSTSSNIADEENTKGVNANNEISSASSKFIDNSREKNVWRRLHDDSVNRESLKNSIHGEVPKKNGRLVLSKKIEQKRSESVQHIPSDDEEKYNREKKVKKATKKKPRKYLSSSDEESDISSSDSDSSFTESSTDERHKKLKKKRLKRTKVKHTFSDYDSDFKPKKR